MKTLFLLALLISTVASKDPDRSDIEPYEEVLLEDQGDVVLEEEVQPPTINTPPGDEVIPEIHVEDSLPASLEEEHAAAAVMEQIMDEEEVGEIQTYNVTSNDTALTNATVPNTRYSSRRVTCYMKAVMSNDTLVPIEVSPEEEPVVTVLNGTSFLSLLANQVDSNVTNRTMPAQCSLTFFYASWCPFSAAAVPHFKGLARLFPDIQMLAVDTHKHYGINTQFGIMSLPTIFLFHNSKPVARFNGTEFNITNFADYITTLTTIEPFGDVVTKEADYQGLLSDLPVPVTDYYLYIAYVFLFMVFVAKIGKSSFCKRLAESIRNTWREAEMHEHIE